MISPYFLASVALLFVFAVTGAEQSVGAAAEVTSPKENEVEVGELTSGRLKKLRKAQEAIESLESELQNDKRSPYHWDMKRSPYHWDMKRSPYHWDMKRSPYHWDMKRSPYHWDMKRSPYHWDMKRSPYHWDMKRSPYHWDVKRSSPYHIFDENMSKRSWWPWSSDTDTEQEVDMNADAVTDTGDITQQQEKRMNEEPEDVQEEEDNLFDSNEEELKAQHKLNHYGGWKRGAGHMHRNARRAAALSKSRSSWVTKRFWMREAADSGADSGTAAGDEGDVEKRSGRHSPRSRILSGRTSHRK